MKKSMKKISLMLAVLLMVVTCLGPAQSGKLVNDAVVKAADGVVVKSYDFEEGLEGWGARGSETVELSTAASHTGSQCAAITNRTSTWHGIANDITSLLEDGLTYTCGIWVMYNGSNAGSQQTLTMSVAETVGTTISYKNLKSVNVTKGQWTLIQASYTYSSTTDAVSLYIEGGTIDFFADDITIQLDAPQEIETDIPSLKDLYADYFKMGTAVTASSLNYTEKEIIKKHFNSITCGNEMKADSTLDYNATIAYMEETGDQTSPKVNFNQAASILKFAGENNIPMRGHCLVWHSQTPRWLFTENYSKDANAAFVSKDVMLQRMENYIKATFETLAAQYPNVQFYSYDVVNEAIDPSRSDGYRAGGTQAYTSTSLWMQVIGVDYIEKAFEYARKYAPEGTLLAYNDYNECETAKSQFIYNMCKKIVEQGNLDVIGMQQHNNMWTPSVSMYETAIRKFASLGVKIEITEMDITTTDTSEYGFTQQGAKYKQFFDKLRELKEEGIDINAAVVWGISDALSWRSTQYPLLFDANYMAKPAFWGVVGDMNSATPTPVVTPTPV
ncbi:endo-1,4-beta-xylanase, partial [Anaeromicropila populeti]